jgi:hypothetical protein
MRHEKKEYLLEFIWYAADFVEVARVVARTKSGDAACYQSEAMSKW